MRELEEFYLSDDDTDYLMCMLLSEKENNVKQKMSNQKYSSQTDLEYRERNNITIDVRVCNNSYNVSNNNSDNLIRNELDILPLRSITDTLEPCNTLGNIKQDNIIIYDTNINSNNNNDTIIKNISPELNISREEVLNSLDEDDMHRNHIMYILNSILEEVVLNKINEEVILLHPSETVYEFLGLSLNKDTIIKNTIEGRNVIIEHEDQFFSLNCINNSNLVNSFTQEDKNISITASTYIINNNIKTENNINNNANNKSYIHIHDTIITCKSFKKPIRKIFDPGGRAYIYFWI